VRVCRANRERVCMELQVSGARRGRVPTAAGQPVRPGCHALHGIVAKASGAVWSQLCSDAAGAAERVQTACRPVRSRLGHHMDIATC